VGISVGHGGSADGLDGGKRHSLSHG